MIEHRHTKRVVVSEEVSIYHRGTLVANCQMKDISADGMAIWAGPLQYHRNTMLEVEIKVPADQPDSIRLSAMVVYSRNEVLGLMFGHVDETARALLRRFIASASLGNNAVAHADKSVVWENEVKRRRAL
jgi:hypothetical protein